MQRQTESAIAQAISIAQKAFQEGHIRDYKPVTVSKSEGERFNSMSSWGPAHKK